jgi:ABC-type transport system substrate-binding protein
MFTHGDLIDWGRGQKEFDFVYATRSFIGLQINFNCSREPFNDVRVRQALTYAMNREAIADIATSKGNPVAYQAFNPEEKWHDPDLKPLRYDPDRARALLKDYGKRLPPFKLGMLPIGYLQNGAEMIQSMWREVGVECAINPMGPGPGAMFQAMGKGEFDVTLNVGGLTLHPTVFQTNLRSDHPFNLWRIKSPRIDAAIDRVLASRTNQDVKAAHFALEQVKADEAPVVFLAYGVIGIFSKRDIGGVVKPTSILYDLHKVYRTQA